MTLAAMLGVFCVVSAQAGATATRAPADFSGTWTMTSLVPAPKETNGGTAALPASDEVLKQTETSLSIEQTAFGTVRTQTFTFDGAENTNKSGATVRVTRTKWIGNKLVTEGKVSQVTSQGYDEWTIKETRSLTPAGVMIVESQWTGRDGVTSASTRQYKRRPVKDR